MSQGDCALLRVEGQVRLKPITRRPADNTPGIKIEQDRQIEPAFGRPDMADVGASLLIGAVAGKVLIKEIGRRRAAKIAVGRLLVATLLQSLQAIVAHRPGNTMSPDSKSVLLSPACMRGAP